MSNKSFYALSYDRGFKSLVDKNIPNPRLKVHSIFKRVINLVDRDKGIYSILQNDLDNGPCAMRVKVDKGYSFLDLQINLDDSVKIEKKSLNIGDKIVISFKNIKLWSPDLLKLDINYTNKLNFNENIKCFNKYLFKNAVDGGSKYYYIDKFINQENTYKPSLIEKELKSRINIFLLSLTKSLEELTKSIVSMIGFGNGLTPSGDDFLVGFITSLNSFEGEESKLLFGKIKDILEDKNLSTTDVSKNMIKSSIVGDTREWIINFIKEVFNDDREGLFHSMDNLFSIGSSSGVDLSVGIILGAMYSLDILENGGEKDAKYDN